MRMDKKIILGFIIISFLGGCASPTAMLGPAYSLSSTGNVFQAGLSYGSNALITRHTGKTPLENLKEISLSKEINKKNIQKDTLESQEFYLLIESKIKKTSKILNLSSQ
jgi:hypothetical protein